MTSAETRHFSKAAPPLDRPKNHRPVSRWATSNGSLPILARGKLFHQRLRQAAQVRALPAHDECGLRAPMRNRQTMIRGSRLPAPGRDRRVSPPRSAG